MKRRGPAKKNKSPLFLLLFWATSLSILPAYGQSQSSNDKDEFQGLDFDFFADTRIRYQSISQDNLSNTAEALTFRVKTGINLELTDWLSVLVEVEGGDSLVDDFNDTINGQFNVPIIPDPNQLELNRLQLQSEFGANRITLGRQDFALDNWRFLGNWQFRQNDQTFDAVRFETSLWGGRLNAGYIGAVRRHFGADSPVGEFTGDSYILNYAKPFSLGQLSLFHYALDLETGPDAFPINTFSTVTTGARWHGRRHWGDYGIVWDVSAARQSDFADNPNRFTAYYRDVSAGFKYKNIELDAGLEILGSDGNASVQTPLGSLHDFQGVTDRFFTTPSDGLRDYNLGVNVNLGRAGPIEHIKLKAGFHQFTSDQSRRDFGQEVNLGLSGRVNNITLLLEYGDYDSQALPTENGLFASDAKAFVLSANYSFD